MCRNANGIVASVSVDTIITVAGMPMKSPMKPANGGATVAADGIEQAQRMRASLRCSIGGHGAVDHGGDAVEHYTDQRKLVRI